jgi:hypothetical protein
MIIESVRSLLTRRPKIEPGQAELSSEEEFLRKIKNEFGHQFNLLPRERI